MKPAKDVQILLPPAVSVIVPVLNEGGTINRTIRHLSDACRGAAAEFIIVDGDPAGSTIHCLGNRQAKTLVAPAGRASQMNAGAEAAKGGILFFVHAD
ncbi:MAG: glycosyltransferase, partial [Desulfobacterales bacterium]|nr:glycosyltransferase [Desulfobacterales bacterium]